MRGGGRYYTALNTDTSEKLDLWSPTTVINEAAKPAIDRWKQRMVAIGICARADLREMIATDDEDAQKEAVQQALEAGKQAANRGTARHAVAERVTTAADAFEVSAELRPWAERFGKLLDDHGIEIKQREIVLVNLTIGFAGTCDMLARYLGRRIVGDIKTGSAGWFDQAMQLAAYANAEYAFVDGELVPLPADIDRDTGYVLHVPVDDAADANLLALPLADAWEAFKALLTVKQVKPKKSYVAETVEPTVDRRGDYRDWLRERCGWLNEHHPAALDEFAAWRTNNMPPADDMTLDQLEQCLTALCAIEAGHGIEFPHDGYPHPKGPRLAVWQVADLRARIDSLPRPLRVEVNEQLTKLPALSMWRVDEVDELEQLLGPAEAAATAIEAMIVGIRDDYGAAAIDVAARIIGVSVADWGYPEVAVGADIAQAIADGLLADDGQPVDDVEQRLVAVHGSKSDVRKYVVSRADDRPVPRAVADLVRDPYLVALAAS